MQLPAGFVSLMEGIGLPGLPVALASGEPEVSVRLNPCKKTCDFHGTEPVPWCAEGLYLPSRPSFTLDPRFHQGRYYVQEAASMFHSWVVRHLASLSDGPLRVLDACAAPGGKTTAVIDALPEGSVVVANEYVPARAVVLRENIIKWGFPGVIVTRGDTASLGKLRGAFDIVIADVPCSGEGMMRKDPEAVAQWSEGLVRECATVQREIVRNLWRALRSGGYMVYSTCTFNRYEDEEVVEGIIEEFGAESVKIPVDTSWGISDGLSTSCHCYRFLPGVTRGEGLFVSVLRKDGDGRFKDKVPKERKKPGAVPAVVKGWIDNPEKYNITAVDGRLTAFPASYTALLGAVAGVVDVIHEGVTLATLKGRDIVPSHALAMSRVLRDGVFPSADIDCGEALRYLHGESPVLPPDTPKGYVLLTFEGAPLGWVKNLGNRTNSLYPQHWRIRRNID